MLVPLCFYARRWVFALNVTFMNDYPFFQIALFIFMSLSTLIIQGSDFPPFFGFDRKLELYNNFSILLIAE